MTRSKKILRNTTYYASYLLIVWTIYRNFFIFTIEIEELFIKPLIWIGPLFYLLKLEGRGLKSLGFTKKNLFPSLYFSLALGFGFALVGLISNYVKYNGTNFSANLGGDLFTASLVLSFTTAFTEELVFRGYIFNRLWKHTKSEVLANLISSFSWGAIHMPIAVFWWKLDFLSALLYLLLVCIFGFGASFVFARTKNIASSILLHVFWSWPIMLFR